MILPSARCDLTLNAIINLAHRMIVHHINRKTFHYPTYQWLKYLGMLFLMLVVCDGHADELPESFNKSNTKQFGVIAGGFSYHWSNAPKDNNGKTTAFNETHNTVGALIRFYEDDDTEIDWAATFFTDSYNESAWAVRRTWGKAFHYESIKVVPKLALMLTHKRTSYKDEDSKVFPAIAPMLYLGNHHIGAELLLFPWLDGFGYVEFEVLF